MLQLLVAHSGLETDPQPADRAPRGRGPAHVSSYPCVCDTDTCAAHTVTPPRSQRCSDSHSLLPPCLRQPSLPGSARPHFPSMWGFWKNTHHHHHHYPQRKRETRRQGPFLACLGTLYVRTPKCLSCCHHPVTKVADRAVEGPTC